MMPVVKTNSIKFPKNFNSLRRTPMPRGRQKDRDLRRKHRKNQQRVKGLEVARREKGKKK
jgi:hypothetical protein